MFAWKIRGYMSDSVYICAVNKKIGRSKIFCRLLMTVFILMMVICDGVSGSLDQSRLSVIKNQLTQPLISLESKMKLSNQQCDVRDLGYGALTALVLGRDATESMQLLQKVFDAQDMNSQPPSFGLLPWQLLPQGPQDANSIDFGTQSWGPILIRYESKLSANFKETMLSHAKAALGALERHKIDVSYTNIYLMNTVNLILLGQATGDQESLNRGNNQLDQWINYTRAGGINEFDSPTYCATDLNSLVSGYMCVSSAETKAKFKSILDYFWSDLAANYFDPRLSLSGPYSRNYDLLMGNGPMQLYYYARGWGSGLPPNIDLQTVFVLMNAAPDGYQPSGAILDLAKVSERTVLQTWNKGPCQNRINYITPDFSVGSIGQDYGLQDKTINIELKSSKRNFPQISIFSDLNDNPYAFFRLMDPYGNTNAGHYAFHPSIVQDKGNLLAILDMDTRPFPQTGMFETSLLLPSQADEVVLDGQEVTTVAPFSKMVGNKSVLGVREGTVGMAVRLFDATGCQGQTPMKVLQADNVGLQKNVARLTIYHYKGSSTQLTEPHVRVGMLILVSECPDESSFQSLMNQAGQAAIRQTLDGNQWQVKAQFGPTELEVGHDLNTYLPLYRRINGEDFQPHRLSVNGQDLMKEF